MSRFYLLFLMGLLACTQARKEETKHAEVQSVKATTTTSFKLTSTLSVTAQLYLDSNAVIVTFSDGRTQRLPFLQNESQTIIEEDLSLATDLGTSCEDYNFDGFTDFAIIFSLGAVANCQTHIFTYQPQDQIFVKWGILSRVEVLADKKTLVNSYKNGPEWEEHPYVVIDGVLTRLEDAHTMEDFVKSEFLYRNDSTKLLIYPLEEAVFLEAKTQYRDHLDTLNGLIRKKKGRLTIPTEAKPVIFQDGPSDSDMRAIYEYKGFIKPLAQYVVSGSYYESGEVLLVDKHSGKKLQLESMPLLSPGINYIASITLDPYGHTVGVLEILKVSKADNKPALQRYLYYSTTAWYPWEAVWTSNDELLMKVTDSIWQESGSYNENYRYIRCVVRE